jgi:integrase
MMRGHIRRRGKGSWAIVIDLGRGADGKRRQKWHAARGTKRDAERELTAILHQKNSGSYAEPTKATVREHLEQWLEHVRAKLAPKTYERYEEVVRLHLIPALGHHQLNRLQAAHIGNYYSGALLAGRLVGKGGWAPGTVLVHHRILRQALQRAVIKGRLARNPADEAREDMLPSPARKQVLTLDEQQAKDLLSALAGSRLQAPTMLALATGMRRGELLALTWANVDLAAASITVCHSLQQTNAGVSVKAPKSGRGRPVALPGFAVEALRAHKLRQTEERLSVGPVWVDNGLVFPKEDGSFWEPDSFSGAFVKAIHKAGLPHLTFHGLRHSHATMLLKQGVNPKIVSERLGHSKVGITLDIYSHVVPGMQEEAAQRIDNAFRMAKPK